MSILNSQFSIINSLRRGGEARWLSVVEAKRKNQPTPTMKEIKIEYINALRIKRTFTSNIPTSWAEITPKQLIAVGEMFLHQETQLKTLGTLLGDIPMKIMRRINDIQMYYLLQELLFLTDYRPRNCFIITKTAGLHAPQIKLAKMTIEQFIYIESYFEEYLFSYPNTPEAEQALNQFIAHLYLYRNEEFDHETLKKRANTRRIKLIPKEVKIAIIVNYRLIREWLSTVYPQVFTKKEESEINPVAERTGAPLQKGSAQQWIKVFDSLVGDDILNEKQYAKLEVHRIFKTITERIIKNYKISRRNG